MYHSLTIKTFPSRGTGSMTFNTYQDFYLVPTSLPIIATPNIKVKSIDVPGANGAIDLTESLTPYPLYKNRTGSLEFAVLNERMEQYTRYGGTINSGGHALKSLHSVDGPKSWTVLYSDLMNKLHGRKCQIILEDDPAWYYEGRIAIDSWKPSNNGEWPVVTFNYELYPYKLSVKTSIEDSNSRWIWDSFNFVDGVIVRDEVIDDVTYEGIDASLPNSGLWRTIVVDSDDWVEYTVSKPGSDTQRHMNRDLSGWMPVCPTLNFSSANMGVKIVNPEIGYTYEKVYETSGNNRTDPECILYDYLGNGYELYFKGHGTVFVTFRRGSL